MEEECIYCHGSGVVEEGEPGDEHEVKCICQINEEGADMSGAQEDGEDR